MIINRLLTSQEKKDGPKSGATLYYTKLMQGQNNSVAETDFPLA